MTKIKYDSDTRDCVSLSELTEVIVTTEVIATPQYGPNPTKLYNVYVSVPRRTTCSKSVAVVTHPSDFVVNTLKIRLTSPAL